MNIRLAACAALALGFCAPATSASAGVYADDLAKCLVSSATPKDRTQLLVWIFSAMSYHPEVKAYSNLTDAQRQTMAGDAGKLLMRLLVEDCRKPAVTALKNEGPSVMEASYSVLGQVAMRGLMSDPAVLEGLGHLTSGIDQTEVEELGAEAGIRTSK